MTIDEATKRLKYSYNHNTILFNNLDKDALKLGIEALKHIKEVRTESCSIVNLMSWPLPNETNE